MNKESRLLVIIPAHNEEHHIVETIRSVKKQTFKCDIVIACDNCSDKTFHYSKKEEVIVFETVNNHHKKAGALNQAFKKFGSGYEFIMTMDSDTVIDSRAAEKALEAMTNPNLGAVCSRAGINPKSKPSSITESLCWYLQHTEYGDYDSSRIERNGLIKVVHGMCALYRTSALLDIIKWRKEKFGDNEDVYDVHNITEDYELTLCLRALGWSVANNLDVLAWTNPPTKWKELWNQRIRWLRGGLDALRKHGLHKYTAWEWASFYLFWALGLGQIIMLGSMITMFIESGISNPYGLLMAAILVICWMDGMYRLRYTQNMTIGDVLIRISLIPSLIYILFIAAVQIIATGMSLFGGEKKWT